MSYYYAALSLPALARAHADWALAIARYACLREKSKDNIYICICICMYIYIYIGMIPYVGMH